MANILPAPIKKNPDLAAFDTLFESRLSGIDFSAVLSSMMDIVPAAALPALALQYGVTGYNGWRYALTEADQRTLLKNAIKLHQLKGTEYAIKEALKMIGMEPVTILKGAYLLYYNGDQSYNGSFLYGDSNPFVIQISVNELDFPTLSPQIVIDAIAIIYEFKSARDYLVSVNVDTDNYTETISVSDSLDLEVTVSGIKTDYIL